MHRPRWAFIYWRSDLTPLMSLAGDPARCTAYLMGNHTIAEQIYREDPLAMLNAPLRTAIYEDTANRTRVAIDEPRMVFASSPIPGSRRSASSSTTSSTPSSRNSTARYEVLDGRV